MRCDVEHVHSWDRSLTKYQVSSGRILPIGVHGRWNTGLFGIRKIFADSAVQRHFQTDTALEEFWRNPEHDIRTALGCACDITQLKLVKNYDSWGRAVFSDLAHRVA